MSLSGKTTVLIILDGWGVASSKQKGNPIAPKNAPHFFAWQKKYPYFELGASGPAVGLFKGQEGNSEAGHLNIGAGRIVKQDALYVSDAIKDGTFFKNNAFLQAAQHAKKHKSAVHLMGLLSNGNSAHAYPEHLYAILEFLAEQQVEKVYLHLFTDGRDSGQHDAARFIKALTPYLHGNERVATIMGRYYGMDRNKNWDRTKAAYEALVLGRGRHVKSVDEALSVAYNSGETDEFIQPSVIVENGKPVATIKDNDALIFFNLRSDRARQLTKTFVQPQLQKSNPGAFQRRNLPKNTLFVAMTDFGPDLPGIATAYPSRDVVNSLTQVLCPRRQLYVAESEKFAHITYFLNGGYAQGFCDEEWVKVSSGSVKNFEKKPAMQAHKIAQVVVSALKKKQYDFIAVNFANADMVGHTGNTEATAKAVQAVDVALVKIIEAVLATKAQCVITADHGNAEEMINMKTGEVDTEHSVNPVPCLVIGSREQLKKWKPSRKKQGILADVAPTILTMMGVPIPREMTGKSLLTVV